MQQDIAVVGMVCRVPGAKNTEEFWQLLTQGLEGLRPLTQDEMQCLSLHRNDNYIAAGGFIDGIDLFDAMHFSLTAREATLMDPQHRLWLQACWQALEISGLAGLAHPLIGVFASAGPPTYLNHILSGRPDLASHQTMLLGNVSDCLATRVSYSLNLTGPSMTIQCGCSSSLVALHQARLALLAKQCDAALVGGICIAVPHYQGYTYIEGGFASQDGHCRPFSTDAAGTVFSSGYGVVVVKRLTDAITAGDIIYAVIKGSAINNDGADKASFTAPGVNGQAAVIAKALRVAGLSANDIAYIETHGTGTPIGDPIELRALELAFKHSLYDGQKRYHIGSVKANLGHLDVAAGIVSFIKTCLMLHHQQLTPQINFRDWNIKCGNAEKLFNINKTLIPWETSHKRRAGVSAFGFGGTNAHVILEEAPIKATSKEQHPILKRLIVLSAKSNTRLLQWVKTLRDHLLAHPDIAIEHLAYTLQTGRFQFAHRFLFVAHSIAECINILERVTEEDFVTCKISGEMTIEGKESHEIHEAWLTGHFINWHSAYTGMQMKKVHLPATPLQLVSYWFESRVEDRQKSVKNKKTDPSEWLYQSVWREKILSPIGHFEDLQPILIFSCDENILISKIINHFQSIKLNYYLVTLGDHFKKCSHRHFQIQAEQLHDYRSLEEMLSQQNSLPHLCLLNLKIDELKQETAFPLNVIFNLVKQNKLIRQIKQLTTITTGMSRLNYRDNNPALAILTAFNRGIGQEFPNIKTQLLDLDPNDHLLQFKHVTASILTHTLTDLCVWRDDKCWQLHYQLQPTISVAKNYFKKNGIYLITGGLGDVASVHVDYLAREYQATLILVGRTVIPNQLEWPIILQDIAADKKLKQTICRLQEWQTSGFAIHTYCGDVTEIKSMQLICQSVVTQFGCIDGILHIAGVGSDMHYKTLSEMDWEHCWKLFAPKLLGIHSLTKLAEEFSISNCLIISSISSALTGIGLSAYGATHNVLDASVSKHHPDWRIMNWDAWSFYQHEHKEHGELGAELDKLAIKPSEGLKILQQAFSLPDWQQLYISSVNLSKRHRYWAHRGFLKKTTKASVRYPRPHLHNEYVAPVTSKQQQLAIVWQSLLGIEKAGIYDSFFELGGHSLLALELINQLQTDFSYSCSVVDLFEAPTIAQLVNKMELLNSNNTILAMTHDRVKKQLAARKVIPIRK